MCKPNIDPNTLAKKINNAPMMTLSTPFETHCINLRGGPKNSNNTTKAKKAKVITIGSIIELLSLVLLIRYDSCLSSRTKKEILL